MHGIDEPLGILRLIGKSLVLRQKNCQGKQDARVFDIGIVRLTWCEGFDHLKTAPRFLGSFDHAPSLLDL